MANAKKSSSKRSRSAKKSIPAVRHLRYELTNSGSAGTETSHFIDLAKDLSAINRRLMRQGRMYHVKRITVVSSNTIAGAGGAEPERVSAGRISFSTAPESWVTQMAWKRGFNSFTKMQAHALENADNDLRGTYNDFKVYLTNDMRTGTVLTAKDNGGNNLSGGDWSYTDLITPDGTTTADEFVLSLLGDHVGSAGSRTLVSLVKSYAQSRATISMNPSPETFNVDDDDPIMNLFDAGTQTDEIIAKMLTDGEDPPYDSNDYPGTANNMPKPIVVQDTTLGADGKSTVGGFSAMCGLIEVESTSPIANDVYSVLVELAPGKYRGIKADVI
jgi:hypothetical protein